MDYENKHKEEIIRATQLWECGDITRENLEYIFPELVESEDEKIRKELIKFVKVNIPNEERYIAWLEKQGDKAVISHKFNVGDWIISKWGGIYQIKEVMSGSYNLLCTNNAEEINSITQVDNNSRLLCIGDIKKLEKQCEQKPAVDWQPSKVDGKIHNIYNSGVEPRFKVGGWVVNNTTLNVCHILKIEHGQYICDDCSFPITKENDYHLWTIQDAKDGDMLLFEGYYNSIVLFQGIGINGKGRINYHCKCDLGNYSFGIQGDVACLGTIEKDAEHYHPATKEQRYQLEKAMADAGYTFDFEKKELRKIEQKPDWSEEDEKIALSIEHVMNCASLLNIVPEKVDKIRTWIKSLKQRMEGKV